VQRLDGAPPRCETRQSRHPSQSQRDTRSRTPGHVRMGRCTMGVVIVQARESLGGLTCRLGVAPDWLANNKLALAHNTVNSIGATQRDVWQCLSPGWLQSSWQRPPTRLLGRRWARRCWTIASLDLQQLHHVGWAQLSAPPLATNWLLPCELARHSESSNNM
jgi:hypothetical protein